MRVILDLEDAMGKRKTYSTIQSELLLELLKKNTDRQFSINEIADKVGDSVGKSTVYRRIREMTNEGVIRRYRENGKSVVYQYVGENNECDEHFHLKCMGCGKVIHLDCKHMEGLAGHIGHEHDFKIDVSQCVLYGKCENCIRGRK